MDLETFLVSLYVMVDEWWKRLHPRPLRRAGRPPSLSEVEVLTLAILAQWPRWRSERDFWRFADLYLRGYFPNLLSQSQLNRRTRALEPEVRTLQRSLAESLAEPSEVYHVLDTTLIPAVVRVRACRKGLFALERHRAKTMEGLLTRLAAKVAAYTCGQVLNVGLGRPIRHLASLLI
jgi:hypothetical protein